MLLLRFFLCDEEDLKDERYRATVRWTVATASDQAPAGARVKSSLTQPKKLRYPSGCRSFFVTEKIDVSDLPGYETEGRMTRRVMRE